MKMNSSDDWSEVLEGRDSPAATLPAIPHDRVRQVRFSKEYCRKSPHLKDAYRQFNQEGNVTEFIERYGAIKDFCVLQVFIDYSSDILIAQIQSPYFPLKPRNAYIEKISLGLPDSVKSLEARLDARKEYKQLIAQEMAWPEGAIPPPTFVNKMLEATRLSEITETTIKGDGHSLTKEPELKKGYEPSEMDEDAYKRVMKSLL